VTYLVDTCVLSEVGRPKPASSVVRWLEATPEDALAISALTLGEIRFGIARLGAGAKRRRLAAWLEALEARFDGRILAVDSAVAKRWGDLRAHATATGKALPVVDGLLAATALTHQIVLVTRNVGDVRATGVSLLDPWTL
jgi:predicted nucleic acid-binding protein